MSPRSGLSLIFALALFFAPFGSVATGQEQATGGDAPAAAAEQPVRQIEKALLVRLVRSTLSAVDQANMTGNYTVLRDLAAPSFAARNSAATLAIEFKPLRDARVDLSPVLVLPIRLSRAPTLDEAGRLDIAGSVPGQPLTVAFWMRFEPINGFWRLLDLNLNLVETASATAGEQASPEQDAAATDEAPPIDGETRLSTTGRVPVPSPKPTASE